MLHIGCGIEIVSLADVPANVGLGTSSSFTVGLLNALHTYKNEYCLDSLLADEAVHLEREVLRESGGIQDQYISAYGGMQVIEIDTDGTIMVNPLGISDNNIELLESKLVFFYTNIQRVAKDIQSKHVKAIQSNEILNNLHQIKAIGEASKYALEAGDVDDYGKYMNEHWIAKHGMQRGVSNGDIDKWYNMAMDAGATGGKLCGAGGGGFLLFHCPDGKNKIREVLTKEGLKELPFKFERIGSRITLNI
jgi:D-glycero-alpha-D-manno-heptose-7-phosphate kinase